LKIYMNSLLVGLMLFLMVVLINNGTADNHENDDQTISPDFKNVDVVIEHDHDGVEYLDIVDVFDKTKNEKPHLLITRKKLGLSEIRIMERITVLIYNHESGELLKVYYSNK